jgi:N-acetylneuraminic acid mutarotase
MRRIFITLMVVIVINAVATTSIFSQVGMWVKKQDMPTARYAMASAVVNGNIYVIGGWGNNKYLDTVEMYDPRLDRWETKASISQGNFGVVAAVVNGKIYAIGGWTGGNNVLSTVEEYDPINDKWTKKANMPTARTWVSTAVVDGIIYAIGGVDSTGHFTSVVEAYNPVTNQWSRKANMPLSSDCLIAVVDGKVYAMGFEEFVGNICCNYKSDVYEYDPVTDTWVRKADIPTARVAISVDAIDGKIYAVGGMTSEHPIIKTSKVEIYNPKTNTWDKGIDLINARAFHVSALIDGRIYIIGGVNDWPDGNDFPSVLPTVEVFDTGLSVSPEGRLASKWGEIKSKL